MVKMHQWTSTFYIINLLLNYFFKYFCKLSKLKEYLSKRTFQKSFQKVITIYSEQFVYVFRMFFWLKENLKHQFFCFFSRSIQLSSQSSYVVPGRQKWMLQLIMARYLFLFFLIFVLNIFILILITIYLAHSF